jgi:hypothetical protein
MKVDHPIILLSSRQRKFKKKKTLTILGTRKKKEIFDITPPCNKTVPVPAKPVGIRELLAFIYRTN